MTISSSITLDLSGRKEDLKKLRDLNIDPEKLAGVAFDELLDWLLGYERPASVSEIEVDRLYKLVGTDEDLELTEEYLITQLRYPLGRARYLLSSIRKKFPDTMSPLVKKALEALRNAPIDAGKLTFKVSEDIEYLLLQIAKEMKLSLEELTLDRVGYGEVQVTIPEGKKPDLVAKLETYVRK